MISRPSFTMWEQENSSTQPGGGTDVGSMMSIQEKEVLLPPHFSFDYKTVAHEVPRHSSSHLPLANFTSVLF